MTEKPKRIVITGAPGTGKTAVIDGLNQMGYHIFPEVIRAFTAQETNGHNKTPEATNPIVFAKDSMEFNKRLIEGRKNQFTAGNTAAASPLFYDRGLPDVLAYMDYFSQAYGAEFEMICNTHRYDKVFIMPPWQAIFHSDGGRFETFAQAVELHDSLLKRYRAFDYELVEVPKQSISARIEFILSAL